MTPQPAPILYALTTRSTVDGRVVIVLHLFRDRRAVFSKAIATSEQEDAVLVLLRCRRLLARHQVAEVEDSEALEAVSC